MNDFAILSNFCECLNGDVDKGDVGLGRDNNSIELFSVLTFRDIMFGLNRDTKVYLYHNSSLPLLEAMQSPFNIFCKNVKFGRYEYIDQITCMNFGARASLYTCEKLIASINEIKELSSYTIAPIFLSEDSYSTLKNINFKNVIYFINNIIKTIIYMIDNNNIKDVIKYIKLFLNIRKDSLYNNVNVNMYTPRYYISNSLAMTLHMLSGENIATNVKKLFNESLPQYNPNTILTMYWDTKFLYPIIARCLTLLKKQYDDIDHTDKLDDLYSKINATYIDMHDSLKGEDYKPFSSAQDFTFRNFYFNSNSKTLVESDTDLSKLDGSYSYGDNINCLDYDHPIVRFNNNALELYIDNIEKFCNELNMKGVNTIDDK